MSGSIKQDAVCGSHGAWEAAGADDIVATDPARNAGPAGAGTIVGGRIVV